MAEIVVDGVGTVERPGDRAEVDAHFSVVAPTREDAVRALGRRVAGLDEPAVASAVRHRSVSVHEEYSGKTVTGFRATEFVALQVDDPAALDAVVAAVTNAGPSWLNGPRWSLRDEAAARREAQTLAVADARARAEAYAHVLGVQLQELARLTDASATWGRESKAVALGLAASEVGVLRLDPDPVAVTARCTLSWTAG
jgi:uncharacterized protein